MKISLEMNKSYLYWGKIPTNTSLTPIPNPSQNPLPTLSPSPSSTPTPSPIQQPSTYREYSGYTGDKEDRIIFDPSEFESITLDDGTGCSKENNSDNVSYNDNNVAYYGKFGKEKTLECSKKICDKLGSNCKQFVFWNKINNEYGSSFYNNTTSQLWDGNDLYVKN